MIACVAILGCACMWMGPREMVHYKGFYVKNREGKEEVAALLARLQKRVHAFLDAAPASDPRIQRLKSRWSGTIAEIDNDAQKSGSLAYSLNKDSIFLCVRASDGSLADENTATFVLIHELAHIASPSYGHTEEFWHTMKYLLQLAEKLGFYTYVDHGQTPTMLCGHQLGSSPLTCVRAKTCASALP